MIRKTDAELLALAAARKAERQGTIDRMNREFEAKMADPTYRAQERQIERAERRAIMRKGN
jgi:hypothetical protein